MIIKQILSEFMLTFIYLIGCEKTKEAVVIDPLNEIDKIINISNNLGLKIKYIFNTHYHADHTNGNRELKEKTGANILIHKYGVKPLTRFINISKIGLNMYSMSPKPDIIIDKNTKFNVGNISFDIIHTQGHTKDGLCFYADKNLFTGDLLFVGCTGRTDLPGGSRNKMAQSLNYIFNTYPEDTIVWPGHDYGPKPTSTLKTEKRTNINAVRYGFY